MTFPDNCIRGILNHTYMNDDGTIGAHLFYLDPSEKLPDKDEVSINWQEQDSVIAFSLDQKNKDGTFQFKYGVVILPRKEIDRLSMQPTIKGLLSYEKREKEDNQYHGNILLDKKASKKTMKQIAATLALHCHKPILREKD